MKHNFMLFLKSGGTALKVLLCIQSIQGRAAFFVNTCYFTQPEINTKENQLKSTQIQPIILKEVILDLIVI